MQILRALAAIGLLALSLIGCGTSPVAQIGFEYAISKSLERVSDPTTRLKEANLLAQRVILYVDGDESITANQVVSYIATQLPRERMTAADNAFANSMLLLIERRIESRVSEGTLGSDTRLNGLAVLREFERVTSRLLKLYA